MSLNAVSARPLVRSTARPVAAAVSSAPAQAPRTPAVVAPAQGAVKTTTSVVGGIVGGGTGFFAGGLIGWGTWLIANFSGVALSTNVLAIGGLIGLAVGAVIGWGSGKGFGHVVEELFK